MHARERIIRDRFADQVCAHCSARYSAAGIVVLARRPAAWMILASCEQCQHHSIFVVRFSVSRSATADDSPPDTAHLPPDALHSSYSASAARTSLPPPTSRESYDTTTGSPHEMEMQPISDHDVDAMHEFLSGFDGDFLSLFAHQHPHATDDSSSS